MKVRIERVPEGLKVTATVNTAKKPVEFIITPNQLETLVSILRTGMKADAFTFEWAN